MRVTTAFVTLLAAWPHVAGQSTAHPVRWADVLRQQDGWYTGDQARAIAEAVLLYQRASGGWPKDIEMTVPPAAADPAARDATIDNGATTTQVRVLARVRDARGQIVGRYRDAAIRGLDYLLAAQYPNGGWPQFFPLREDYSRHITFNDNAMVNVLRLLDEAAEGRAPFEFVDEGRRLKARGAVTRGVDVILKAQIAVGGELTAWCAQHDEITLQPRPARTYEHVSLSGMETVGIVRFLMTRPTTAELTRSIDTAVTWLRRVRLSDGRWARFYELETNRPIFSGRDGVIRYKLEEIEQERRDGYAWLGTWPRPLVEEEYPAWKQPHRQERGQQDPRGD
jgi:PelA/Pel-15E family pectate lyase